MCSQANVGQTASQPSRLINFLVVRFRRRHVAVYLDRRRKRDRDLSNSMLDCDASDTDEMTRLGPIIVNTKFALNTVAGCVRSRQLQGFGLLHISHTCRNRTSLRYNNTINMSHIVTYLRYCNRIIKLPFIRVDISSTATIR